MAVWIEVDLCNGCKRCIKTCPYGAVELRDGKAEILDRCTSCGACLQVCKQKAIHTDVAPRKIPDFTDRQGVWVFAEQRDGVLHPVSLELLGKAGELAAPLKQSVSALLLGYRVSGLGKTLIEYGAETVYVAEHQALKDFRTNAYTKVIEDLIKSHKPNILLMGATHVGRDLAPRVSRRVEVGLTADCTELIIDPEEGILLQTRPAFGGNVMATIANRYSRPQMATVRPGVMEAKRKAGAKGKIVKHKVSLKEKDIGTKVLELVREKKKGVNLSEAKVIVAGGRGVGDAEGIQGSRIAGIPSGRRDGGHPGSCGRRLDPCRPPDRADGAVGEAGALHCLRHFRCDPASRGHHEFQVHRGCQQGPESSHFPGRRLGHCRGSPRRCPEMIERFEKQVHPLEGES
jgi:electron transfer flavoprotein alpha subunit/NAD-dependent dihydropyrimidine dehydrogenase PreA subunit